MKKLGFFRNYWLGTVAILLFLSWIIYTPPGLSGKVDAVGYAVCHQIESHSFLLGDHAMPMCARCTGMYLGALLGIIYQMPWKKKGGLPSIFIWMVMGLLVILFAVDGVNSYLHFFPDAPHFYEPTNVVRLVTGTGLGLGIAMILMPIFQQSIWQDWSEHPAIENWRSLFGLFVFAGVLILAVIWNQYFLLYPLAILSAVSVLILLTLCYSILWAHFLKREYLARTWRVTYPFLTLGFITTIFQVFIFDIVRYMLTGTWGGFVI